MRSFSLLMALALLVSGCGSISEADREARYGTAIVADDEPWLVDALERAQGFWARQGIKFDAGAAGDIQVLIIPGLTATKPDRVAEYDCTSKQIRIDPAIEAQPREAVCVVAHEMGHYLGMDHVSETQTKDLMARVVSYDLFGDCFWSEKDEAELRKAQVRGPGC